MKTYLNTSVFRNIVLAAAAVLTVASCGGGGGGGSVAGGGTGGTGLSFGVMTKGSVIVNGVKFEDTTANIFIDDKPKNAAALQTGMVVKVLGTVSDDRINGTAQQVKALIEARGNPSQVNSTANPQSLQLLGQTVFVDDQTVYSNINGFAAIAQGTQIEVHGLRDATGQIHATRIEDRAAQMGDNTVDEIRGVVNGTGTNPPTFTLGSQSVNAAGATIAPAGATYTNGSVVEVYCNRSPGPCIQNNVFQASRIVVEDSQDAAFKPSSGQRLESEGLVTGLNPSPVTPRPSPSTPPTALSFKVAGVPVTTSGSTRYVGGIFEDMANNIKVEAEGSWNGTTLVAEKIEFKRSVVRLQGFVATSNPSTSTFTLTITGAGTITVEADSLTQGDFTGASGRVPPVAGTTCIQVRGQRKAGTAVVVTAGEIRNQCSGGGGSGGRHFVQAPVEAETPETFITLLGFQLNVSNPTDTPNQWVDINDQPLTKTAFFNAVTPTTTNAANVTSPGTLVKVTFDSGATTVRQVELED